MVRLGFQHLYSFAHPGFHASAVQTPGFPEARTGNAPSRAADATITPEGAARPTNMRFRRTGYDNRVHDWVPGRLAVDRSDPGHSGPPSTAAAARKPRPGIPTEADQTSPLQPNARPRQEPFFTRPLPLGNLRSCVRGDPAASLFGHPAVFDCFGPPTGRTQPGNASTDWAARHSPALHSYSPPSRAKAADTSEPRVRLRSGEGGADDGGRSGSGTTLEPLGHRRFLCG